MATNFLDSDDSSEDERDVTLKIDQNFKINEEYANKFTYNKNEELRRLEEKHGKSTGKRKRDEVDSQISEESSTSEDEDDSGELATEALDTEIFATLNAIRSKDPKVYDPTAKFYKSIEEGDTNEPNGIKEAKPLYLRDYHRETLLSGDNDDGTQEPLSYNQELEALKKSIVAEMHAASSSDSSEDEMLVAKQKPIKSARRVHADIDVANAERDPEEYLNKFMSSRAGSDRELTFQELESDDSDEEKRAEEFEEAYNLRFEDPAKSNEKLRTHDREMAAQNSVRREEINSRRKKRESEREKKERKKQELRDEKARLRKLRIEEIEDKVRRIKRAAGMKSNDIKPEDWAAFVDGDWDDTQWESEMQKRFGNKYYEAEDAASDENDEGTTSVKKRKVTKPKFDDDIDIKDIVPDFVSDEEANFSISDDEVNTEEKPKSKKNHKQDKQERKKHAKKERRIIEQLVDDRLELDNALRNGPAKTSTFRYRETSPTSFGLSARDILMADDSQLNQYIGLKKLAAFRDPAKKRKDMKNLGKKARLRKWRKDAFGDEEGPQASDLLASSPLKVENPVEDKGHERRIVKAHDLAKKKKRRHKKKQGATEEILSTE